MGITPPQEWVELARQKHLGLVEIRSAGGKGTLVQVTVPMVPALVSEKILLQNIIGGG